MWKSKCLEARVQPPLPAPATHPTPPHPTGTTHHTQPLSQLPTPSWAKPPNYLPKQILQRVKDADKGKVFWAAVDDKRYHATMVRDYNAIIIHPNWLDKVKRGLDQGSISTPDAFIGEMRAVFINCFTYNRREGAGRGVVGEGWKVQSDATSG